MQLILDPSAEDRAQEEVAGVGLGLARGWVWPHETLDLLIWEPKFANSSLGWFLYQNLFYLQQNIPQNPAPIIKAPKLDQSAIAVPILIIAAAEAPVLQSHLKTGTW